MKKVRLVVMLAAVAALLLPTTAQASTVIRAHRTTSGQYVWHPHKVNVNRGSRVVWRNPTSVSHTVTAYSNNWNKNVTISSGSSTSFTFRSAGTYKFRCTIHSTLSNGVCSGMCGKVVVG